MYRNRRIAAIRRSSVYHLARVLYLAHSDGWRSVHLHSYHTTHPSSSPRCYPSSGYVRYQCLVPVDGIVTHIDIMITSQQYAQAVAALPVTQQHEIRSYYRRRRSKHDVCPDLEDSHYRKTYDAFAALLPSLLPSL